MTIIDLTAYRAQKAARKAAAHAAQQAETLRRQHLEQILTALLAELQAA